MFERHVAETAESIQDIEIRFIDDTNPQGARQKRAVATVQKVLSTGRVVPVMVNLRAWYLSQDRLQEIRLLSSYLDNIRSEANVEVLPEGVGIRVPGETHWVNALEYMENIAEAASATGNSEQQVHDAVINWINSQIPSDVGRMAHTGRDI